jgi:hypothetical protein
MFVQGKTNGPYRYLQIVENHREGKRTVQRVLATLGRGDKLAASGGVEVPLKSLGRFANQVRVIQGYEAGRLEAGVLRHIAPDLVFGRLWRELGLDEALHRLFESGSYWARERWRRDVREDGSDGLKLSHLYRVRRWLGNSQAEGKEALFQRRRDPCSECTLAFFDPTSLYFEGRSGEKPGGLAYPRTTGRNGARCFWAGSWPRKAGRGAASSGRAIRPRPRP